MESRALFRSLVFFRISEFQSSLDILDRVVFCWSTFGKVSLLKSRISDQDSDFYRFSFLLFHLEWLKVTF